MLLTEPEIQKLRETSSEFDTTITILKWNCLVFFTGDIVARTAARYQHEQLLFFGLVIKNFRLTFEDEINCNLWLIFRRKEEDLSSEKNDFLDVSFLYNP